MAQALIALSLGMSEQKLNKLVPLNHIPNIYEWFYQNLKVSPSDTLSKDWNFAFINQILTEIDNTTCDYKPKTTNSLYILLSIKNLLKICNTP